LRLEGFPLLRRERDAYLGGPRPWPTEGKEREKKIIISGYSEKFAKRTGGEGDEEITERSSTSGGKETLMYAGKGGRGAEALKSDWAR